MSFELILIIAAGLLLISVLISKISDRSGIPALLLFLTVWECWLGLTDSV
jgi:NhaP-type Na+/H+ and K+/H+ antiporter